MCRTVLSLLYCNQHAGLVLMRKGSQSRIGLWRVCGYDVFNVTFYAKAYSLHVINVGQLVTADFDCSLFNLALEYINIYK